jgi:hypothetical protein
MKRKNAPSRNALARSTTALVLPELPRVSNASSASDGASDILRE